MIVLKTAETDGGLGTQKHLYFLRSIVVCQINSTFCPSSGGT